MGSFAEESRTDGTAFVHPESRWQLLLSSKKMGPRKGSSFVMFRPIGLHERMHLTSRCYKNEGHLEWGSEAQSQDADPTLSPHVPDFIADLALRAASLQVCVLGSTPYCASARGCSPAATIYKGVE